MCIRDRFLYCSGQEAGNILESDQRNVKAVAETDKTGSLVTGVNVKEMCIRDRL